MGYNSFSVGNELLVDHCFGPFHINLMAVYAVIHPQNGNFSQRIIANGSAILK